MSVTDTGYLYQYFLENSTEKKDSAPKDIKKANVKPGDKEDKSDGKHAIQRT